MPRGRPRRIPSTLPPCYRLSHGAVYFLKANKWTPIGTTEADAHAHHAERLRQSSGTLAALIDAFVDTLRARRAKPLSKNTLRQYGDCAKVLKHMLKLKGHPRYVLPKDAASVKVLLGKNPGMANRVLSFARITFAHFLESQVVDSNPFIGIRGYPREKRTRLITQTEWDAIYAKATPRLRCIMDGWYLTDQRVDDVIGLDERNILDDGPGIYFKQRKTGKELIVAWNPQLREWVARCRLLNGSDTVIPMLKGRPRPLFRARGSARISYTAIGKDWRKAVAAADVEYTQMRDARAFSATEANRQGLDAQKLLGHTDRKTTSIYLRDREIDVVQGPQMLRTA